MDQGADDPSSLDGESSRSAGSVCHIALGIFLERKRFELHPSLLLRRKETKFPGSSYMKDDPVKDSLSALSSAVQYPNLSFIMSI